MKRLPLAVVSLGVVSGGAGYAWEVWSKGELIGYVTRRPGRAFRAHLYGCYETRLVATVDGPLADVMVAARLILEARERWKGGK